MVRFAIAAWVLLLAACGVPEPDRAAVEILFQLDPRAGGPPAAAEDEVALGKLLFAQRLGDAACSDCHAPDSWGQDGKVHGRNTPVLTDVARQLVLGWDGTWPDLGSAVRSELQSRHAIATDEAIRFALAPTQSGTPLTVDHVVAAISAYLATWRSRGRWDRYVEGQDDALSANERRGLATFVEVGCATCHAGRTLGGRSAHKLGLAEPYPCADLGKAAVTGRDEDRSVWKAPMLRLVTHTAPYLHDGSVATLPEMVKVMGRHELGKSLSLGQVGAIVEFLNAVGEVDGKAR